MQPEGLLPCAPGPATCPYPELDQFGLRIPILIFKVHFNIILTSLKSSKRFSFLNAACTRWFKYDRDDLCVNKSQFCPGHIWTTLYFCFSARVPHATLILYLWISLPSNVLRTEGHECHHYAF